LARIAVRLSPRAGSDRIDGVVDGLLRVRVAAPPVDDAANEALLRLLARALDRPRGAVRLAGGSRGRRKVVEVDGLSAAEVEARWPGAGV
jgi:uncharacterized protein YggU (UPF0235/DUF167 family)